MKTPSQADLRAAEQIFAMPLITDPKQIADVIHREMQPLREAAEAQPDPPYPSGVHCDNIRDAYIRGWVAAMDSIRAALEMEKV